MENGRFKKLDNSRFPAFNVLLLLVFEKFMFWGAPKSQDQACRVIKFVGVIQL